MLLDEASAHLLRIPADMQDPNLSIRAPPPPQVGAGTSPAEGAALGAALLSAFAGCGPSGGGAALTLATTHAGELKARGHPPECECDSDPDSHSHSRSHAAAQALKYGEATGATFENAAVEMDAATLAPTFRLLWARGGPPTDPPRTPHGPPRTPTDPHGPLHGPPRLRNPHAATPPPPAAGQGVPGRSRAMDIALRLGLEPAIVAAARERTV